MLLSSVLEAAAAQPAEAIGGSRNRCRELLTVRVALQRPGSDRGSDREEPRVVSATAALTEALSRANMPPLNAKATAADRAMDLRGMAIAQIQAGDPDVCCSCAK